MYSKSPVKTLAMAATEKDQNLNQILNKNEVEYQRKLITDDTQRKQRLQNKLQDAQKMNETLMQHRDKMTKLEKKQTQQEGQILINHDKAVAK